MHRPTARAAILLGLAVACSACDLIAEQGQTLTLGNQGTVFGSGGNARRDPLPAVRVQPGGTVVVQDASLFAGGLIVEDLRQAQTQPRAPGIRSDGGTVRVEGGFVRGGPSVQTATFEFAASPGVGIDLVSSTLEVSGGTIMGGDVVATNGPAFGFPGRALESLNSTLRIGGGTFVNGGFSPRTPSDSSDVTVVISGGRTEIRGGEFNGGLNIRGSDVRMSGGHAVQLFIGNDSIFPGPNCSEIRGGEFEFLFVAATRVLLFGTGFVATPPEPGSQQIQGTLEDGTRIDAPVLIETGTGGTVELLAPGSPGCP